MSVEWNMLPLLPLRYILDHLSEEDALAATATCRHWRQAMLLYEGKRDVLSLEAKNIEKNLFLTSVFRKHIKKLHIQINCNEDQFNEFLTFVLPEFFDTKRLEEVVFIGPIYLQQSPGIPFAKLRRIITESLVFKHEHFLEKLGFLGCEMSFVEDEKDRFVHKQVEYYSKPLTFSNVMSPADTVLSRSNVDAMMFSTLQHILFEYELISTEALETLAHLSNLNLITLNVINRRKLTLPTINWRRVNGRFSNGVDVAINIISVPHNKFKTVVDSIFVEGMSLISLKVMFCKTLYVPLISHVCCLYNRTLQEFVWADSPLEGPESARTVHSAPDQMLMAEVYNQVNPFILLCWQCDNLRRMAVHGYWVWQYDVVGFVRLRKSLKVEISSPYAKQDRFGSRSLDGVFRVMDYDLPPSIDDTCIQEMNSYTDRQWRPHSWRRLHPGLRSNSSPEQRADYIVCEVLKPLGVT